jgi:hypothetical protein
MVKWVMRYHVFYVENHLKNIKYNGLRVLVVTQIGSTVAKLMICQSLDQQTNKEE